MPETIICSRFKKLCTITRKIAADVGGRALQSINRYFLKYIIIDIFIIT